MYGIHHGQTYAIWTEYTVDVIFRYQAKLSLTVAIPAEVRPEHDTAPIPLD